MAIQLQSIQLQEPKTCTEMYVTSFPGLHFLAHLLELEIKEILEVTTEKELEELEIKK